MNTTRVIEELIDLSSSMTPETFREIFGDHTSDHLWRTFVGKKYDLLYCYAYWDEGNRNKFAEFLNKRVTTPQPQTAEFDWRKELKREIAEFFAVADMKEREIVRKKALAFSHGFLRCAIDRSEGVNEEGDVEEGVLDMSHVSPRLLEDVSLVSRYICWLLYTQSDWNPLETFLNYHPMTQQVDRERLMYTKDLDHDKRYEWFGYAMELTVSGSGGSFDDPPWIREQLPEYVVSQCDEIAEWFQYEAYAYIDDDGEAYLGGYLNLEPADWMLANWRANRKEMEV